MAKRGRPPLEKVDDATVIDVPSEAASDRKASKKYKYKYPVNSLLPHHRVMVRRMIEGVRQEDIAQEFGLALSTVQKYATLPIFKQEINRLMKKTEEGFIANLSGDLRHLRDRAIEVLDEDMHITPSDLDTRKVRQKAAMGALDFTLGKKEGGNKINAQNVVVNQQINFGDMSESELRDSVFKLIEGGDEKDAA